MTDADRPCPNTTRPCRSLTAALSLTALLGLTVAAGAQTSAEMTPTGLQDVGVEERLGESLPMDLAFTNGRGEEVTLGDYFQDDKPVIITPVYYNCPMLCTLIINGLVEGMEELEWTVGEEFRIVTYSFAPEEAPELAATKKKSYLDWYDRPAAEAGWAWLVGSEQSVHALNEALGYSVNVQDNGEIAHSASIMFITPDGRIARYMNDVVFQPRDLRLALIEASDGEIGSPMEKILLFNCFQYSSAENAYVLSAWKVMRLGAALTLVLLAAGVGFLLFKGSRHDRSNPFTGEAASPETNESRPMSEPQA